MMRKWKSWTEGLSATRQPNEREDDNHRVSRKDRSPPRVGRAYTDPRERERADDRDEEDEAGREDRADDRE